MVVGLMLTGLVVAVLSAGVSAALGASAGLVMAIYAASGATAMMGALLPRAAGPRPL